MLLSFKIKQTVVCAALVSGLALAGWNPAYGQAAAQTPAQIEARTKATSALVQQHLGKSGLNFEKVEDGQWGISLEGEHNKDIVVAVIVVEDVVVFHSLLADRKAVADNGALLVKLLELSHEVDSVKVALAEDHLYVGSDIKVQLLNADHLKYIVNQVAVLTDEAYPFLKVANALSAK